MIGKNLVAAYRKASITGANMKVYYIDGKVLGGKCEVNLNKFTMKAPNQVYQGLIKMN